ncbi:hypothetical protein HMPREF1531_02359 [Propionibacterium sp. oral taxon 192 str. F0372]|uniref:hypothetical protein n=1 Tax=Propionibacterium sp. oral taxon 192 TaxID=671222 RepID=UPI000352B99E|nr:hypothetical protein [Propionibacterium sp. oral taxon 192]EPH00251.1 hypothetical protein HMPREF1531_02359 [Propionibacterium sp. oral taxon 192 str. F0372]
MNLLTWWATTVRVLRQMVADCRTIMLMLAVPAVLLVLLYFVYVDVPTPPSGDGVFPTLR